MRSFLLVISDHDQKVFSIEGPMSDDTPWIKRVVAAQEAGRKVNCFTPGEEKSRALVASQMRAEFGFDEVEGVPLPHPSN